MANYSMKTEKVFKKPYPKVFDTMKKVLDGKDFYITNAELDKKCIRAHTNLRLFSWGEDMEITFVGGEMVKVKLDYKNCKSFIRKLFIKREADNLFKEVEKKLN